VLEIWNKAKAGDCTRAALAMLVQQTEVQNRIAAAADRKSVVLEKYDVARNEVASVAEKYAWTMKLLRSLLNAVVTASAILVVLHVAILALPVNRCRHLRDSHRRRRLTAISYS
jgi:hypothetical protein